MSDKKKGFSKSLFSAGGLLLILLILVLINFIFSNVNLRVDATEGKLYSLSDSTKKIIGGLAHDVTIKFFYSENAANTPVYIKTYAKRLLDFLAEYEYYSNGKITLEVYDPKADSEEEEWAQKYGIEGIDLPTGERMYLGLTAMAADQEESIPFLDPSREEQLEYDITRIISRVQNPKKVKIGVISSLPVFGQQSPMAMGMPPQAQSPWVFVTELRKTYQVSDISEAAQSISEVDLLVLLQPQHMTEALQYAVDQYVLRGGNIIVFADPFSTLENSPGRSGAFALEKLFKAWGIGMDSTKALIDFSNATRLRTRDNQIEDNPLWLSLKQNAFNANDIITAKLESMLLPVAGVITKLPESSAEYEPLLQSSSDSNLVETFKVQFGVNELRREFKASNAKQDLAVKLRGHFSTAFPEGRPSVKTDDPASEADQLPAESPKADETHLSQSSQKSTIIVVGDSDMLFDAYYVNKQNFLGFEIAQVFNDNLNFLLNACEVLTGSDALVDIRSRGKFERPFTRVQQLEAKAQTRWLAREQELEAKVEDLNLKLGELERNKDVSQKLILSEEQEAEIIKFQKEKQRINKELKIVRRNLRADIENLGNFLKIVNIFLMPLMVACAGIGYALYRRKKSSNA